MSRAHNFSAGPVVLPLSVIEQLAAALPEFQGTGQGLMEVPSLHCIRRRPSVS